MDFPETFFFLLEERERTVTMRVRGYRGIVHYYNIGTLLLGIYCTFDNIVIEDTILLLLLLLPLSPLLTALNDGEREGWGGMDKIINFYASGYP